MKKTSFFFELFVPTLLLLFASMNLNAQAGALDPSFNLTNAGANNTVEAVAIQDDGKIIIGGLFTTYNGTTTNGIARIHPDGSKDTDFNPGTGVNGSINTIAIQADGKILIGGNFTLYNGTTVGRLARINSDGSLDASFIHGIGATFGISSIAIQADGKIIIGGEFNSFNGIAANRIARINSDGSLDAGFNIGTGPNDRISTIFIQDDGKIIIGGDFTSYNGIAKIRIARINPDGSLESAFNSGLGPNNRIFSGLIQADGKIIIAGNFTSYDGVTRIRIARIHQDGSLDTSFNPGTGANNTIFKVAIQDDGKIIITGRFFTTYNGTSRNKIARILTDGSLDSSFNPGTGANTQIFTAAIQDDGKIIIVGTFTIYNGTAINRIARLFDSNCTDPVTWYIDTDNDGFGNSITSTLSCAPPLGYANNADDCNDANNAVHPNVLEVCNGIDDDCNGLIDDADPDISGQKIWYMDTDGDNFGDESFSTIACFQPSGYTLKNGDCDNGNNAIHPFAPELCNGIDDDCDGTIDEGFVVFDNSSVQITASPDPITCATTSVTFTATNSGFAIPVESCSSCGGHQALDGSNKYYKYATVYDWDCCLFGSGIFEDPTYIVDGHYVVEYDCNGNGTIVESTGSYVTHLPLGSAYNQIFGNSTNPTYKSLVMNPNCCNGAGDKIYVILSNERKACEQAEQPTFIYQWKVNGMNVGIGDSYTTTNINANDVVTCVLTVNSICGQQSLNSNAIEIESPG